MADFAGALAEGGLVLDGGLATELEAQGHDLSDALWSARLLADDPHAVVAAHRAFYAAGARVATTASYQASFGGFAAAGLSREEAAALMRRSVRLADQARAGMPAPGSLFVAASVGPYGASLADGSEYTGAYDLDVLGLRAFHRPRLEVLAEAGADVLAVETMPCLAEVEALLEELARLDGIPAWLSLTCAGGRTRRGEDPAEAFAMAADVDAVVAVGVNCTAPGEVAELVPVAAASGKPVLAYPNSGEGWDARTRSWTGDSAFTVGQVTGWLDAGASAVGGCCRVGPADIAAVAGALSASGPPR
ncbi:homocysteine S-methyltransferase [Oryzihumus leptocrescens]|uniref:Homocysteine S-methyltransferase n=1 Tax=Oryzihumus leptocrescens TaxID=297536 RepID=A0A542Z7R0_9MICO|nr:homocysteine S-methyltransferase [Oryzihumus leptocrescens]TQL56377.1 homocysteine S-methyltransferase [Oryzihumus leptocrescens]